MVIALLELKLINLATNMDSSESTDESGSVLILISGILGIRTISSFLADVPELVSREFASTEFPSVLYRKQAQNNCDGTRDLLKLLKHDTMWTMWHICYCDRVSVCTDFTRTSMYVER